MRILWMVGASHADNTDALPSVVVIRHDTQGCGLYLYHLHFSWLPNHPPFTIDEMQMLLQSPTRDTRSGRMNRHHPAVSIILVMMRRQSRPDIFTGWVPQILPIWLFLSR